MAKTYTLKPEETAKCGSYNYYGHTGFAKMQTNALGGTSLLEVPEILSHDQIKITITETFNRICREMGWNINTSPYGPIKLVDIFQKEDKSFALLNWSYNHESHGGMGQRGETWEEARAVLEVTEIVDQLVSAINSALSDKAREVAREKAWQAHLAKRDQALENAGLSRRIIDEKREALLKKHGLDYATTNKEAKEFEEKWDKENPFEE